MTTEAPKRVHSTQAFHLPSTCGSGLAARGDEWVLSDGLQLQVWTKAEHSATRELDEFFSSDSLSYGVDGSLFAGAARFGSSGEPSLRSEQVREALIQGIPGADVIESGYGLTAAQWSSDGANLVVAVEHRPLRRGRGRPAPAPVGPTERLLVLDRDLALCSDLAAPELTGPWSLLALGASWVVAVGADVRAWELGTGAPLAVLDLPSRDTQALATSPDESLLWTAGADGRVSQWTSRNWALDSSWFSGSPEIWSAAIDPTGSLLATGDLDGALRFWSVGAGRPGELVGEHAARDWIRGLCFAGGGEQLIAATSEGVEVLTLSIER